MGNDPQPDQMPRDGHPAPTSPPNTTASGQLPNQFGQVFEVEWGEILLRRKEQKYPQQEVEDPETSSAPPKNLVGLALSGGGIRSATFCLGLVQGLHKKGVLHLFDYLSTVSGGGYFGGWWSAWLERGGQDSPLPPGQIFPTEEELETERAERYLSRTSEGDFSQSSISDGKESGHVAEGSISAGADPLHHLRLFANYLTPRKGILSADTWRAIAIITRNLAMTWLILVPLVVAVMLLGHLFFAVQSSEDNFTHRINSPHKTQVEPEQNPTPEPTGITLSPQLKSTDGKIVELGEMQVAVKISATPAPTATPSDNVFFHPHTKRDVLLHERLLIMARPLVAIFGWIVWMASLWMIRNNSGSNLLGKVGAISTWALIFFTIWMFTPPHTSPSSIAEHLRRHFPLLLALAGWMIVAAILWAYAWRHEDSDGVSTQAAEQWKKVMQRNQTIRVHATLLVMLVVVTVVLLFAGYAHELVEYLYDSRGEWMKQVAGWGAIVMTVGGSIYTAFRASPSGGGDPRESGVPTLKDRIIFAVTPPLVIIMLVVASSWLAHVMLSYVAGHPEQTILPLTCAAFVSVFVWMNFAALEMTVQRKHPSIPWLLKTNALKRRPEATWLIVFLSLFTVGAVLDVLTVVLYPTAPFRAESNYASAVTVFLSALVSTAAVILVLYKLLAYEFKVPFFKKRASGKLKLQGLMLVGGVILGVSFLVWWRMLSLLEQTTPHRVLASAAVGGLFLCASMAFLEVAFGKESNPRNSWLLILWAVTLTTMLYLAFVGDPFNKSYPAYQTALLVHACVGLFAILLGWVVALGWMADPNGLTLHMFYKERLVRGYLGASNFNRNKMKREITESAEGDDVMMRDLQNCQRGAPYHLVNTTLNLVGGRDLATAQRSSAAFVLSKKFCGSSSRTGYRATEQYMDGRLSLGTAVAASGAAGSPNMGSQTPPAALGILMTFLNIRLGFWAPTPNRDDWQEPQARLWPFYTLRELLSQTNDLANYCYLTDGGHFDNTGLYSLVERGCRFIVVADCGADPTPCFADLGEAIRRCRIDFDTEFDLRIEELVKADKKPAAAHFAVGEITYSERHMKQLRWPAKTRETECKGVIVVFKPAILEKDETLDVRQYAIQNSEFPQQTTGDQWFDEAQFESYRRLGETSATYAFPDFDKTGAGGNALNLRDPSDIATAFSNLLNKGLKRRENPPVKPA